MLSAILKQNKDHLQSTGSYLLPHLDKIIFLLRKLEREAGDDYADAFTYKFIPKGTYLLTQGAVCKYLWFLKKGIARVFQGEDGNENTMCFFFPGEPIDAYYNSCMGGSSEAYIQLIQDSAVYVIDQRKLKQLALEYPVLSEIEKLLFECHTHWVEQRMYAIQKFDAKERYARLIHCHKTLISEIPGVYLASYLKVKPETFSRIKAKFNGS